MKPFIPVLLLSLISLTLNAAELSLGQPLPEIQLDTQHEKPARLLKTTRLVIFSADKQASDLVKQAMEGKAQTYLDAHDIQIVADISAMPALVTRMFALPKLKKRPYALLLAQEAGKVAMFPRMENHVTLVSVESGQVIAIEYVANTDNLLNRLP